MARPTEAMDAIESGTQPFLLAVPSLITGRRDAAVLVERIAELEDLGLLPTPVDLAQALLRVTPASDEQVVRAAEKLRSDGERRTATGAVAARGWSAASGLGAEVVAGEGTGRCAGRAPPCRPWRPRSGRTRRGRPSSESRPRRSGWRNCRTTARK
nr:hypothetical protein [Streptomyces sp. S1D4-11]QIY92966.1 hypothetical protein HEP87_00230 [Streptomyces sp. S1D4-11]